MQPRRCTLVGTSALMQGRLAQSMPISLFTHWVVLHYRFVQMQGKHASTQLHPSGCSRAETRKACTWYCFLQTVFTSATCAPRGHCYVFRIFATLILPSLVLTQRVLPSHLYIFFHSVSQFGVASLHQGGTWTTLE